MLTIQVNGREIQYRLSQGNSRGHVTLKFISEDELEIILPKELAVDIETLLKKKAELVERKRLEYVFYQEILDGQKAVTLHNRLLFFGKFYDIETHKNDEDYNISLEGEKLRIRIPRSIERQDVEYDYLRKWIRNRLRETLNDFLYSYSREMKASINRVYIKNQKARWASYTSKCNLNFNIKLAALPKNIVDYVIIHELAHYEHQNHSKNFWLKVNRFCPNYKNRKKELEKYSLIIQKNQVWKKMMQTPKTTS